MEEHVIMEYNKIDPNVYIGTNACCVIDFEQKLLDKGVTANISLEYEKIDNPEGVDYFLWLPTKDRTAPTFKQLVVGVNAIETLIKQDEIVYIHCMNGHGRAPTLYAAYLISQGYDITEAIQRIRNKRSEIHIQKVQMEALEEWRQYVRSKKEE